MSELVSGISASIIAAAIIAATGYLFRHKAQEHLIRFALRRLGIGIDFVYSNQSAAENVMVRELSEAKLVRILHLRGRSIAEGYLSFLLKEQRRFDLLLADPDTPSVYNPLVYRAQELGKTAKALSPESFVEEGRAACRLIRELNSNKFLEIRAYQFPAVFRLIATEKSMFLSYYPKTGRAREGHVYHIRSESHLFEMFSKHFDQTWNDPRTRKLKI